MSMKLSEALDVLLEAEDEALAARDAAEQEAREIIRKAREAFAAEQETQLNAAREESRAQVESARQSAEMEALHIAQLARSSRDRMQGHFEVKAPALIARLAEDAAIKYAAQGRD